MVGKKVLRKIGFCVCVLRGHRYFYPFGFIESWCAYQCLRCGKPDKPLDLLPPAPGYDWQEDNWARIDAARKLEQRWIRWLPWPRWA